MVGKESGLRQIPGVSGLLGGDGGELPPASILLLEGPAGSGKTMYCRQFLADGLAEKDHCHYCCIYVSSSISEKQFRSLFSGVAHPDAYGKSLKFVNPNLYPAPSASRKDSAKKLSSALSDIRDAISAAGGRPVRVAVDSVTHLMLLFGEKALVRFMVDLSGLLRESEAAAIFTLTTSEQGLSGRLSSLADGVLELKIEEGGDGGSGGTLARSIRLRSIKGIHHKPAWVPFTIADDGSLAFGDDRQAGAHMHKCMLCHKPIAGAPVILHDFVFDTEKCMEIYRRLEGVYESSIFHTGLPAEAFNTSFFFVDIVGLSDPSLSVKKQVEKIRVLNELITSCSAFKKAPVDKRIILPTGDGMAIGFLLNPELPLELAIQLHRNLRAYGRGKPKEDQVEVRIGLAAGPVFSVTDLNNVQNIWGPGIILARRVMDTGDSGHILLEDKLAEELKALKDDYRRDIKKLADFYEIKHGQKIGLYSAYSHDFGNPEPPKKLSSSL